ncbi:hypothetical protein SARC_14203, partial [Sphaeroforma arctica JP610]
SKDKEIARRKSISSQTSAKLSALKRRLSINSKGSKDNLVISGTGGGENTVAESVTPELFKPEDDSPRPHSHAQKTTHTPTHTRDLQELPESGNRAHPHANSVGEHDNNLAPPPTQHAQTTGNAKQATSMSACNLTHQGTGGSGSVKRAEGTGQSNQASITRAEDAGAEYNNAEEAEANEHPSSMTKGKFGVSAHSTMEMDSLRTRANSTHDEIANLTLAETEKAPETSTFNRRASLPQ